MKPLYVITIEVEAITDRADLFAALVNNVLIDGFAQYLELGDLESLDTLSLLCSAPQALDEQEVRLRRVQQDRLRLTHKILEKRLTYRADEATQGTLPGLE